MKKNEHLNKCDKSTKTMKKKEQENNKKAKRVKKLCDNKIFKK